jgi:hypothetical protein
MSGKAATFGGRMMGPVADQVLNQFAANFAARVQATQASPSAAAPASGMDVAQGPHPRPLNGFALAWAVIKGWLRTLFAAKKS